jgi:NAD(P)H-hydrate epimerase
MCGACILCGSSILRTGAGMVKIITPACNREILQQALPEAMLYTYEGQPDPDRIAKSIEWADVVVAGPGLGMEENALLLMEQALGAENIPLVADADGLNLIATHESLFGLAKKKKPGTLVVTPHPGELVRLLGEDMEAYKKDREGLAHRLAERLSCVVAAKDAVTFVAKACREELYINTSGNDGMATAGSGDVLAGIVGGLLAQGMEGFEAACLGVYLHGLAGDRASFKRGRFGMTAGDIIKALTEVMNQM